MATAAQATAAQATATATQRYVPFPNLVERVDLTRLYPEEHTYPVFIPCPAHGDRHKPNLAVYRHNTYCHACHYHEGALEHIKRVKGCHSNYEVLWWAGRLAGDYLGDEESEAGAGAGAGGDHNGAPSSPPLPLDPEIVDEHINMLHRHPEWYGWLRTKYGLSREAAEAAGIGHTGFAYTLPVYRLDGTLATIRYRIDPVRFPGADLRYYGRKGYNQAHWFLSPAWVGVGSFAEPYCQPPGTRGRFSGAVFVTEGEFDALALWQVGFPTISATNGAGALLTEAGAPLLAQLLEAGVRVVLMYDQDSVGRSHGRRVWRRLRELGIEASNVTWPARLGKDAGELMSRELAAHGQLCLGPRDVRSYMRVYPFEG